LPEAGHFSSDSAEAYDCEGLGSELCGAKALPVVALFLSGHVEVVLDEDEHGHDAELCEGGSMHPARGGEGDVGLCEPCAFRSLADTGAGGLYPFEVGGEFLDAAGVPGVEVSEYDLGLGEVV
jgi:hypothetical protein